ncbi:hypothetical protein LI177_14355, partial [bacterium 210820-DFI.6.37]|nr:hypothetical protein [bacterium 210820-DFI.6.37]
ARKARWHFCVNSAGLLAFARWAECYTIKCKRSQGSLAFLRKLCRAARFRLFGLAKWTINN